MLPSGSCMLVATELASGLSIDAMGKGCVLSLMQRNICLQRRLACQGRRCIRVLGRLRAHMKAMLWRLQCTAWRLLCWQWLAMIVRQVLLSSLRHF